ncbi:MAG TPA: putative collagen-binding domain-containing protein [Edaphobacter sp.]|nr:putative collagen-binding domain-containing protein [Edaphobacter sp.]
MKYLPDFVLSVGKRYQDLVPDEDLVVPNKTHMVKGYEGWAYAARTADKNIYLAYFEKGCLPSLVRGARVMSLYRAKWFDPRTGAWSDVGPGQVATDNIGEIHLPAFPSDNDWGLNLTYVGPAPLPKHF